jgi:hypothetical protein
MAGPCTPRALSTASAEYAARPVTTGGPADKKQPHAAEIKFNQSSNQTPSSTGGKRLTTARAEAAGARGERLHGRESRTGSMSAAAVRAVRRRALACAVDGDCACERTCARGLPDLGSRAGAGRLRTTPIRHISWLCAVCGGLALAVKGAG